MNGTIEHDFYLVNGGSIFLLTPLTEAAKDWVNLHIPDDAQWFWPSVVIEHRYVDDILDGLTEDGLAVGLSDKV